MHVHKTKLQLLGQEANNRYGIRLRGASRTAKRSAGPTASANPAAVNPILYLCPDIKFGGVRRVPASARDNSVEEMGRLTFGRFCQAIHHCKNNKNKTGNIYHIVLFC